MYYIQEEGEKKGPFSLEDLIALEIRRDTLIWKQGSKEWFAASKEESLKHYFSQRPPEVKKLTKVASNIKVKLSDRFWCFVFDAILYEFAAIFICYFIFSDLNGDIIFNTPSLIILLVVLFLLIRVLIESTFIYYYGKSFMQKIAKIRVQTDSGEKLSFSTALVRTFLKNILAGIPTLLFYWLSDSEFLHERLTNTEVKYEQL